MHYNSTQKLFCLGILIVLFWSIPAAARWSNDPAVNLAATDAAGEQTQSKVAAHGDYCYISWFDGSAGYDARLQHLDPYGDEQWAHNGILVADMGHSWFMDYGLDVDQTGNAILAFIDDRFGDPQVTANLISPSGTLLWGINGVQLTSVTSSTFVGTPDTVVVNDGNYVVGWVQDENSVIQKLSPTGTPLWGTGVVLSDTGTDNFHLSDMQASNDGGVIISCIKEDFMVYRYLYAQKLDKDGNMLWGTSHKSIYDYGSLQMGNYPDFVGDSSGGGVFAWYSVTYGLQVAVQRLMSDGTEVFPHNGVEVSTNASQCRVNPDVCFDPVGKNIYCFWVEMNLGQSEHGIYGQKISSAGTREWTDNGLEILPVDKMENSQVRTLYHDDGPLLFFVETVSPSTDHIFGARLDSSGTLLWSPGIINVSTATSDKSKLSAALVAINVSVLAWTDDRDDAGNVYAQNINFDGTLGPASLKIPVISWTGLGIILGLITLMIGIRSLIK